MVLYPNKLPESERVCFGICRNQPVLDNPDVSRKDSSYIGTYGWQGHRPYLQ